MCSVSGKDWETGHKSQRVTPGTIFIICNQVSPWALPNQKGSGCHWSRIPEVLSVPSLRPLAQAMRKAGRPRQQVWQYLRDVGTQSLDNSIRLKGLRVCQYFSCCVYLSEYQVNISHCQLHVRNCKLVVKTSFFLYKCHIFSKP